MMQLEQSQGLDTPKMQVPHCCERAGSVPTSSVVPQYWLQAQSTPAACVHAAWRERHVCEAEHMHGWCCDLCEALDTWRT